MYKPRIGYKKAHAWTLDGAYVGIVIITLELCKGARAILPNPMQVNYYNKCRTNKAVVLKMQFKNNRKVDENKYTVRSDYTYEFTYSTGQVVEPTNSFCYDKSEVCASGIHYFQTRKEAIDYDFC